MFVVIALMFVLCDVCVVYLRYEFAVCYVFVSLRTFGFSVVFAFMVGLFCFN